MSSTHFLVQQKIPRNKLSEQITNKIQNLGENPWILKLVNEVAIHIKTILPQDTEILKHREIHGLRSVTKVLINSKRHYQG